jgi:hypothetical protein
MNPKRLILGIVAVFVGIWGTNMLIHAVWLQGRYTETMSLWRAEDDMQKHMIWLMLGQFLAAWAFVVIWARKFAANASVRCAIRYGLGMGFFSQANTLVTFAVQPLPADIAMRWFVSGLLQGVLMGVLVFFVYKPKPEQRSAATVDFTSVNPV